MIKSLSLTNFRKVEESTMVFSPGLNVIRGANEASKTTRIEAISYVLFGSKALRSTFADTVTHGKPETSLKVEMVVELAGRTLSVKRSKGGAEVVENGVVIVTGQTEVTAFLSNLIGADANAAGKLMLANQGNLRGALEQGPKAMSQMIEDLSGMDLFERLIDAMQEKLMMGSTGIVESSLSEALIRLEAAEAPVEVDVETFRSSIAGVLASSVIAGSASDAAFAVYQAAEVALNDAKARAAAKTALQEKASEELTRLKGYERQESTLMVGSVSIITPDQIEVQRQKIAEAKDHAALKQSFEQFASLSYPADFWEGTREEFVKAQQAAVAGAAALRNETAEIQSENKVLAQQKVSASLCGFCGKDFTDLPEIAEKNRTTDLKISTNDQAIAANQVKLVALVAEVNAYLGIDRAAKPFADIALRLERYVTADENFWPPKLTWAGPVMSSDVPDVAALNAELVRLQAEVKKASDAAAQLVVVQASIASSREKYADLMARINEFADVTTASLGALDTASAIAHQKYSDAYAAFATLCNDKAAMEAALTASVERYAAAKSSHDSLVAAVAEKKDMLEQMNFNNSLLKKIRAARPIIADKLWSMVLASVSTMFSRMRGEVSVVAKGKDGFTVNGSAVETLSGSTLDLLGLSLRVALTRTFIPHSPFLVLDEPFAACDVDRSVAMLGFIKSSGFTQTLLVTHDEISETVADQLVEL